MGSQITIGVASTVKPCDGLGRSKALFFERMAMRARQMGARLIVFHPEQMNLQKGIVTGYVLSPIFASTWTRQTLDMPDVLYDNVFVHLAVQGLVHPLRSHAKEHHIPLFNPSLPGKGAITHFVSQISGTTMHVPQTKIVQNESTVVDMMDRYRTVYVKPTGGYGGRGVLRLTSVPRGIRVECDRFQGDKKLSAVLSNVDFHQFYQRVIAKRTHIVQEQIPLLQVDGANVDFRVVLGRDRQGEWQVVGIVPKVAAKHGVVTNLVAGGHRLSMNDLAHVWGLARTEEISDRLIRSAKVVSYALSKRYKTFGLVGYDLGVDDSLNVWYIEMNPKPARRLLFPQMRNKAGDLAVDFAYYLAQNR